MTDNQYAGVWQCPRRRWKQNYWLTCSFCCVIIQLRPPAVCQVKWNGSALRKFVCHVTRALTTGDEISVKTAALKFVFLSS